MGIFNKFFNRRKDGRYELMPPLKCVCSCREFSQEGVLSHIINVSKSGMLITVNKYQIAPGGRVEVQFQLPPSSGMFLIHGVATRSYMQNMQGWFVTSIKFTNKNETAIRVLWELASKRTKK